MPSREARARVGKLFADHQNRLQQYLRARLSNPDDAAELAQEAYLRMLRVKRADLIRHPQAYLFRIANNLYVDWFDFWLNDRQYPDPAKAEQYARWRGYRKMQEKVLSEPRTPLLDWKATPIPDTEEPPRVMH